MTAGRDDVGLACAHRQRGPAWRKRVRLALVASIVLPLAATHVPQPADAGDIEGDTENAIGRLNHAGHRDRRHCSAVLVAPKTALTAAHCVAGMEVAGLHLLLGYRQGRWNEHLRPRRAVALEPPSDVAALCLETPARATPIPIAREPVAPGATVAVPSYGKPAAHLLHRTDCRVVETAPNGAFSLDCPLAPGASGAPVLRPVGSGDELVGIVSKSGAAGSLAFPVPGANELADCGAE